MSSPTNPYESPRDSNDSFAVESVSALPEVHFEGILSIRDAIEAHNLAHPWMRRFTVWGSVSLASVISLLILSLAIVAFSTDDPVKARNGTFGTIAFSIILVAVIAKPFVWRYFFKRSWQQRKPPFCYSHGRIDDECVHSETDSTANKFTWAAFRGYRISESVAVLIGDGLFSPALVLAQTKFANEDDWKRALAIVSQKLPAM